MKAGYTLTIVSFFTNFCLAQGQQADVKKWVSLLKDNSSSQALTREATFHEMEKQDTASIIRTAYEIEKITAGGSKRTQLIGNATKAKLLFYYQLPQDSAYAEQMKVALLGASKLNEPYLEAEYSRSYAEMLYSLKKKPLAAQYAMSSLKIHEYMGIKHFPNVSSFYMAVGEMLFFTRNERDAINYLLRGLELTANDSVPYFQKMFTYNNLGNAYKILKKNDSALYYFKKCMDFSLANNRPEWHEAADFNRFECYIGLEKYDTALNMGNRVLKIGEAQKDESYLMFGYWMTGLSLLKQKEYNKSLPLLLKAREMGEKLAFMTYYKTNKILAECYEGLGQPDKAYPYLKIFKHLDDSLEQVKAQNTSNYLHTKALYDEEQFKIKTLEAKRKRQIYFRNISIISLVVLSALCLWWLNRKRKKALMQQRNAEEKLMNFKTDIIQKNEQVEALLAEINEKQDRQHLSERIDELSQQMILTEDDWQHFKSLFEKSYPGFFQNLRKKATGITEAEMRMAALIKIQLNTKQMAAMQGISAESIHKNRQRLRQRLALSGTDELENFLNSI
jgi:tetratricopeptide (TPR) repeat protein